ncbi:response regulator transcription factor [Terrimonas ferruginea]|uniref:response regulator transcription factor n=1 Tax=Terrimonas ferruginea TaxID=249 RepID=UPI000425CB52|nr:response regulator transcription factor [Terrimonas ferruginea]
MNIHPFSPIKIAIVDDHNLFRKGLIKLINLGDTHRRYSVLFEAESGLDLKEKLNKRTIPDIMLMDIDMPDMDGYETVSWLRQFHPGIRILVISMFENEEAILRMLQLGVRGYLSKDIEVEDIHHALEAISSGGYYYSERATEVRDQRLNNSSAGQQAQNMSEREREFLKLACTDMTYVQIADVMNVSVKTIDGYREELFKRFGFKNRVTMAMYAVKIGLYTP